MTPTGSWPSWEYRCGSAKPVGYHGRLQKRVLINNKASAGFSGRDEKAEKPLTCQMVGEGSFFVCYNLVDRRTHSTYGGIASEPKSGAFIVPRWEYASLTARIDRNQRGIFMQVNGLL